MARTSLFISIAFAGIIMLSIAEMALGVSSYNQGVGASDQPHETAKEEQGGTVVTGAHVANGLVTANRDGEDGVDFKNGQVKSNGNTGVNAADGLADVNRKGHTRVDLKNGQVNKGGKNKAKAGNGLVDEKKVGGP
ncbi:hypothetical protein MKW98_024513 [Papaver atlanticum]|uniref:Uncharacterized protein n=1 Tax=Papaver atlanticum TaxID=357466 RepID=A0AAD4X345_9MAGN|nr:hypothetical protein MKW98_024513 [Papaver atlanticum]